MDAIYACICRIGVAPTNITGAREQKESGGVGLTFAKMFRRYGLFSVG